MNTLKLLYGVLVKNFKRMVQSKSSLAAIFLGPFIILLLINGAYSNVDSINLDIGLVLDVQSEFMDDFKLRLIANKLEVFEFTVIDNCINNLKHGTVDVCIEANLNNDKPAINFHIDYSKMNLINVMMNVLTKQVGAQTESLRLMFLQELASKIQESAEMVSDVKKEFDSIVEGDNNPLTKIDEMKYQVLSTTDFISSARSSLADMKTKSRDLFLDTDDSLDEFKDDIESVESKAKSQQSVVNSLQSYTTQCETSYLPEVITEDFLDGYTESELIEMLAEYGKCKCIDYFRPNLETLDSDLELVIVYLDDAGNEIGSAKIRNKDFYDSTIYAINKQERNLVLFESQKDGIINTIDEFNSDFTAKLFAFKDTIDAVHAQTENISAKVTLSSSQLANPIDVVVKPISIERDMIVYVFPMMYFFILMFISLIFSSTFAYSEKKSLATDRNLLSPLNDFIHSFGMYLSLVVLIFVQGSILILLANWYFDLAISLMTFIKIAVVSFTVISLFVILGILLGNIFKSQLIVMLTSIAFVIVLFLYSDLIRPLELMSPMAHMIISINPFVLGATAISKLILFEMPLGFMTKLFGIIVVEVLAIVALLIVNNIHQKRS